SSWVPALRRTSSFGAALAAPSYPAQSPWPHIRRPRRQLLRYAMGFRENIGWILTCVVFRICVGLCNNKATVSSEHELTVHNSFVLRHRPVISPPLIGLSSDSESPSDVASIFS